jgi:crossover junction endodeoxyribonuclease RusA
MIRLPYPPSVNHYRRHTKTGHSYISDQGRAYKNNAALTAREQRMRQISGPVSVRIFAFCPRRAGDLDNLLKATLDALCGVAYADDSQIELITIGRFANSDDPHLEVTVTPCRSAVPHD